MLFLGDRCPRTFIIGSQNRFWNQKISISTNTSMDRVHMRCDVKAGLCAVERKTNTQIKWLWAVTILHSHQSVYGTTLKNDKMIKSHHICSKTTETHIVTRVQKLNYTPWHFSYTQCMYFRMARMVSSANAVSKKTIIKWNANTSKLYLCVDLILPAIAAFWSLWIF